jgi:hypothetical protein
MGGRELETIARTTGGIPAVGLEDVQRVVDRGLLAVPAFAAAGGPFRSSPGRIEGVSGEDPRDLAALGVLYCSLMTDLCLDLIGAKGPCIVEGSFVRTPAFAALLAALRHDGEVLVADEVSGTTAGAILSRDGLLARVGRSRLPATRRRSRPLPRQWRAASTGRLKSVGGEALPPHRSRHVASIHAREALSSYPWNSGVNGPPTNDPPDNTGMTPGWIRAGSTSAPLRAGENAMFAGRSPQVIEAYERLPRVLRSVGPVTLETKRTSIHLLAGTHGSAFAGVHPQKAALLLNIRGPRASATRASARPSRFRLIGSTTSCPQFR